MNDSLKTINNKIHSFPSKCQKWNFVDEHNNSRKKKRKSLFVFLFFTTSYSKSS